MYVADDARPIIVDRRYYYCSLCCGMWVAQNRLDMYSVVVAS